MNPHEQKQLYDLITASVEGDITPEQFMKLKRWLDGSEEAVKYYVDYMSILSDIRACSYFVENEGGKSTFDVEFWSLLSEHEKAAPVIEIQEARSAPEIIQKVERPRLDYKIKPSTIFSIAASVAAIVLLVLFVRFVPPKAGYEVATLVDSIDVMWTQEASLMQTGSRLVTGRSRFTLREGMVKLLFDNGAKVLIESPAEFKLLSEDHVELLCGRLYAKVPPDAIGFTVSTLSAQIVDLGTEFGVEVDYSGDISLHVIKGKTSLTAGDKVKQPPIEVQAGKAKKVTADTQAVSDVPCDNNRFIRDIDSANNLIWRGEPARWEGYINWTAESGQWSDGANWDTGAKPDGTRHVLLQNGSTSVCTLNTIETPISSLFTASNGQTLNIVEGGSMGCDWSRFGESTVNMSGNGTWLLNDDDLYIGYPYPDEKVTCMWTMYDNSRIDINKDNDDGEVLYISQDAARGTLKLVGSNVTVNCDQLYVGFPKNPGYSPYATLEYVMDTNGASTIHVGYRVYLSEGDATAHLVFSTPETLPAKDIVLIENTSNDKTIRGDGAFDTMNGGPAIEGTPITLGGNRYTLTYQYEANSDGCHNDIALVFQKQAP